MKQNKAKKVANYLKNPALSVYDELNEINERLDDIQGVFNEVEAIKGEKGDPGESVIGPTGPEGPIGPKGDAGTNGKDGKSPIPGIDFVLPKDGADGKDGKNGSPDTSKEIKQKLESLKGDDRLSATAIKDIPNIDAVIDEINKTKRIHVSAIKDLPVTYPNKKVLDQRWHGSGVTKIIAGTNVTISPTDGLGDVIVNVSGGSSGIIGTLTSYFVNATTGNNANDGLTAATPFLTIQKALNTLAVRLFPGNVAIFIADGTYNEQLVPQEMMGATTASGGISSRVFLLGNSAIPGNVRIIGSGGRTFWFNYLNTIYSLSGLSIEGNGAGRGIQNVSSRVFLTSCDIKNVPTPLQVIGAGAYLQWNTSATGGNIVSVNSIAIQSLLGANVSISKKLTITGIGAATGIQCTDSSILEFAGGFDMTAAVVGTGLGINAVNGSTIDIAGPIHIIGFAEAAVISSRSTLRMTAASCTVNLDNCTAALTVDQRSVLTDVSTGGNGYTYTNGTPAVVSVDPDGVISSTGSFMGGATIGYVQTNTNSIKLGQDNRFPRMPQGSQAGNLPLGVTVFFNSETTQANYMPLYIADANETVVELIMVSGTGNGAAHTDTYTLYKNGVATAMTFNVTNAATGSTTANQVNVVKGDHLGFAVTTDAATAAANVLIQAKIIKR